MVLQETYELLDAKCYAPNSKIDSQRQSYSGHYCTFIPYNVQYGDTVQFIFNSKPTHCLIGIGTAQSSCFVLEFNTNQTKYHRSYLNGGTYNNNWLDTRSKISMDMSNLSTSEDKVDVNSDTGYIDYWRVQLRTNNNGLRIEKFNNDDYNIDVIIL